MSANDVSRRVFVQSAAMASAAWFVPGSAPRWACGAEDDGWVELFDGKTLAGWHKNPQRIGHGTGGSWTVESGAITGEQDPPGSGNGGILLTDRKFGDFEVTIDMKPDWGVCSGFFLRSTDEGRCFQMMVDYHDAGNVGHIYGEGTGGFNTRTFDINGKYDDRKNLIGLTTANHKTAEQAGLESSCSPEDFVKVWKVNDWNSARVMVRGEQPQITTWINGLQVCRFDGNHSSAEGYDKQQVRKTLGAEGHIAVQVHGGQGWPKGAKCRWRNVKIRTL